MPCWMLNLIKVQQACVGHRRGLRTPPPWAASASCNPSSMAAPVPGAWNAATATSLSSPARPAYWRHKREQMATATGPKAPPTTTCTGTLSPAMDGLEKSWPGSACLTRPSPWTYANPRSTSTGSGPPQAARMIALLRIRLATTMPTTSMTRTPARDSPGPIRTPYRRVSRRPRTGAAAGSDEQAHRLRRPVRGRPETQPERRARSRPRRHPDDGITDAVRGSSHSTTPVRIT
jgi:hypothetical protein